MAGKDNNESDFDEIPLLDGNSNGAVVRIGNTVRREIGAASHSVHRLLIHMENCGFSAAPKFLGIDQKGRETLSYIHGNCCVSAEHWSDERYLLSAADLLSRLHKATNDYPTNNADKWRFVYPDSSKHEVICHNDFAPYNLIANNGNFTGVIDFDLAGPGPRLRDVAYAAYWLTPLSQKADDMQAAALADAANGSSRLKRFCLACGVNANTELLDMVSEVLHYMGNEAALIELIGASATNRLKADGHLDHWQTEAEAFDVYRITIEKNL